MSSSVQMTNYNDDAGAGSAVPADLVLGAIIIFISSAICIQKKHHNHTNPMSNGDIEAEKIPKKAISVAVS